MEISKLSLPTFSEYLPSISGSSVMWIVLGVFALIYTVISVVLVYHWSRYGMGNLGVWVGGVVFVSVSVVLFSVALLSLSYF